MNYALLEFLDVNWMMCFPLTCLLHCFEVFLPNLKTKSRSIISANLLKLT